MKNADKIFYAVLSTFRITLILALCTRVLEKEKKNLARQNLMLLFVSLLPSSHRNFK